MKIFPSPMLPVRAPLMIAATVGFILQNRYLNGGTIRLDGAVRLAPK